MVKLGLNFDISMSKEVMQELITKIPEEISFNSNNSLLKVSRQHVKG